jgi:two-component system NarL family sensor kinase
MIESAAQSSGVAFEQKLDSADDALSAEAATNLYRVVQESLNNILKHSRAKRARIELERDVREIVLRIEDDGDGFDVNSVEGAELGLRNMTERVHILGGTLKVDS